MRTACEDVRDELALLVDGDRDAIGRHAEHLSSCDDCRDARHDAGTLAARIATAGDDFAGGDELAARVLAALGPEPADAIAPAKTAAPPTAVPPTAKPAPRKAPARAAAARPWIALGMSAAAAAAVVAGVAMHARHAHDEQVGMAASTARPDGAVGKVTAIDRAAADKVAGLELNGRDGWRPLRVNDSIAAGAELRTDDRTRASLELADGTKLVLDHRTQLRLAAAEPRQITMSAGRLVADVVHVDRRPASVITPNGTIDVVGTKLAVTAADALTSVQVARGSVVLRTASARQDVRAGEEGIVDHGALSVSAAPAIGRDLEWSELQAPAPDDATAGLGSLRAYKAGEARDRDWNLALASHDVKVRIVGPIARTEITETFRNDSGSVLEGVYQFPLPADAQIDALGLDDPKSGGFIDGAFVDKARGAKIFAGVIQKAAPQLARSQPEIIWVPGRWRDPALLEWQRGGRFELKVYPIPAGGARTIKLAYTQVVAPHGAWRQYVYPLPYSHDGSTVADRMTVDVEVRGAEPGLVRASGYDLAADPARHDVNALTLAQTGFVPRGDLVVDYRATDGNAELRAWSYAGGAAVAPDDKLARTQHVGLDPKVLAAQREVAADLRPTAVIALSPHLPRWREDRPRDYAVVIDSSQSMFGERYTRATELAAALVGQMDRRDRVTVMACDSECRTADPLAAPTAAVATATASWLRGQTAAGASDIVAAIRAGTAALADDPARDRWVLYVGDGFASTGFRREADVERALAASTRGVHVSTIAIGGDADAQVLAAAARGGGGSYVAWLPGERVQTAATAALETSYGAALRDATVTLPDGLADAAPTVLPTLRAGDEQLIAARITSPGGVVHGDVVLRGTVGGQPFEQRYPLALAVSSAPGNGFVPRLWASLAIEQLEQHGTADDRARIVGLSQGYSVMSRETSLLVLESQAMFDAFGVDRQHSAATWTGEESLDEVATAGTLDVGTDDAKGAASAGSAAASVDDKDAAMDVAVAATAKAAVPTTSVPAMHHAVAPAPPPRPVAEKKAPDMPTTPSASRARMGLRGDVPAFDEPMVAMRRVWERIPSVTPYDGVAPSIDKAIADFDAALTANPDSREKHRALVQALAYAGELDRARTVAARWLDRDPLDPQALGYEADLVGRDGQRDAALRTLDGLVDLDPDRVALQQRLVGAYERVGRLAEACGHRIAIASIAKDTASAGAAVRCLRGLGRTGDAEVVLRAFDDDRQRAAVEKAATVSAADPRIDGDLVIRAHWNGGDDLDLTVVSPEGTRVSWMGGRTDLAAADVTSSEREELAIKSLRRGNYLVEISRANDSTAGAGFRTATGAPQVTRGTLDVTVLGEHRSLPFELIGSHLAVARVSVALQSHLEEVQTGQRWRYVNSQQLAPE